MELFEVLGICLIAVMLSVVIGNYKKEYAVVITVAVGCIILVGVISTLVGPAKEFLSTLKNSGIQSSRFFLAAKVLAIGYITQFIADTCRDFGQSAVAAKAELAGRAAIFVLTVPLLQELFTVVTTLID